MIRNHAAERYHFPLAYFMAFFEHLPHHARFVLASYQDQVIAATLYLHDDICVYSYLGGADHAFQSIRPTNAIIYDTIGWAHRSGKQRLILGGGYQPDDGIFRFKSSFSPLRATFQVYRHIHLPDTYAKLCDAWSTYYNSPLPTNAYFPAYRSMPESTKELVV
jgi:lipid II:glycine glycyltransferase (peptidoglycan interpeptide bridge formation enzyme)